jgi:hypothetical protein
MPPPLPPPPQNAPVKPTWICLIVAWVLFVVPFPGFGIVGWFINLAAFILAIVVMARGLTSKGLIPLLASIVVSPIIYFLIGVPLMVALVSASAPSYKDYVEKAKAAKARSTQTQAATPAIQLSASDLLNAYKSNEVAADSRYEGKRLEVTGIVKSINSSIGDTPVVNLDGDDYGIIAVRVYDLEKNTAATLAKRQRITVNCLGGGIVMKSPVLRDCTLR